jgi:hypothetical protein
VTPALISTHLPVDRNEAVSIAGWLRKRLPSGKIVGARFIRGGKIYVSSKCFDRSKADYVCYEDAREVHVDMQGVQWWESMRLYGIGDEHTVLVIIEEGEDDAAGN